VRKYAVRFLKNAGGFGFVCAMILATPSESAAGTADDLQKAKGKGQVAFVLVTEPGAGGIAEAESVISDAVKKLGKAVLIQLDRTRPENAELVTRYRLAGPQIPIVLVFASNGIIAGGSIAAGLTTERLLGMVPTKREVELIGILQSGKSALVLASRSDMVEEGETVKACKKAEDLAAGKLGIVRVDLTDKAEKAFLAKLKIDVGSRQPVTVVISSRGQVTGSFIGPANPSELVLASAKMAGGCCPGGRKAGAACPAPAR